MTPEPLPDVHPDYLDLDRWALGIRTAQLDAHVAGCDRCRAHVDRVATPLTMPASVRERAEAPRSRFLNRLRVWWLTAGVGAVATAAVLMIRVAPYDGVKGSPTIAVYVKRDGNVTLWDGAAPVQPGDRIQLKVAASGYRYVSVGSAEGGGAPEWLYTGETDPSDSFQLPVSWRVDGASGAEALTIVLSRNRQSNADLTDDSRIQARNADVWTTQLVLPKKRQVTP